MEHPISRLSRAVSAAVVKRFGAEHSGVDPAVHRSAFADYQADVALRLARAVRKPPIEVAQAILAELEVSELCDAVSVSKPGFVNFVLKPAVLASGVLATANDPRAGVPATERPQTIVIDYSGPNVAKEMHVGHLRSTVIGDSLVRCLTFAGHRVVRQNHVGDWGTPFGMLVEHLLDVGAERAISELSLGSLKTFYQAARSKFDQDPAFAERARRRVVLLQSKDAETLALWKTLVDASLAYLRTLYDRFGILLRDADVCGESFYNAQLPELSDELERSGLAKVDQGALCVFLPEFKGREGEPLPLIVRKQDGGYGYAATDLAAVRYRVEELGATRILYVVGAPQQQHLAMVFAVARRAGWLPEGVQIEHVAFGSILGPDRKLLRTRSGETPRLSDLLDEAVARAEAAIREKNPDLAPEVRARVAQEVGTGAIKYADLSSERIKDYVFDWSRMLAFEGNTGPYLQYAHARISSILRRVADDGVLLASQLLASAEIPETEIQLEESAERALALELIGFAGAVEGVEVSLQPHRLCTYLYELATRFTQFYESCPVLRADTESRRDSRLLLCAATRRVLATGLGLLGMGAPDRM